MGCGIQQGYDLDLRRLRRIDERGDDAHETVRLLCGGWSRWLRWTLNGKGRIFERSKRLPLMKSSAPESGFRSSSVKPLENRSTIDVIGC